MITELARADAAWAFEDAENGRPADIFEPGDVILVEMLDGEE